MGRTIKPIHCAFSSRVTTAVTTPCATRPLPSSPQGGCIEEPSVKIFHYFMHMRAKTICGFSATGDITSSRFMQAYAYTSRTSHVSVQTMHDVRQPAIYSSIEALKPLPQYSTAGFKTSLWCALIEFSQQEEVSERNHAWACIRLGACVLN